MIVGRAESLAPIRVTEWPAWPVLGPVIILYWTVTISLGLGSLVLNDRRAPDAESRRRTRVLAWGMVLGLTPISILHTIAALLDVDPYDGVPFWIWATCVLALFLIPRSRSRRCQISRTRDSGPAEAQRAISARPARLRRPPVSSECRCDGRARGRVAVAAAFAHPAGIVRSSRARGLASPSRGAARLHRRFTERIDRAFFRTHDARRVLEHLAVPGRAWQDARSSLPSWLDR